jgi:hypothetical protein
MSELMYVHLPDRTVGELELKPSVASSRAKQRIELGQSSRQQRLAGNVGLNSYLLVDTAGEVQAGRGFTYHSLHLSEVAFWPDEDKMTSLLNTVPDDPDTLVVVETTANGHNFFRRFWKQAEAGVNDYLPIFFAWHDDANYTRPFLNEEERARFVPGDHEWGEAEPGLIEDYGLTLEQLNWRRWAIANRVGGDLRKFQQEYPSNPDEAFLATGKHVFSMVLVSRILARTERLAPPDEGLFAADEDSVELREVRGQTYRVPHKAIWTPREKIDIAPMGQPWWRRWADVDIGNWPGVEGFDEYAERTHPGQYIVTVDPSSDEETTSGEMDYHAVEVIDHKTLEQVAELRTRSLDADEIMLEALLAAIYFNNAWIAVEKTGGYGLSILGSLSRVYRYPWLYRRRAPDMRSEKQATRLGWDTNEKTKRQLIDYAKKIVREGVDGIRSPILAGEMATYVHDELGRANADSDAFDDCLMAWMIGQSVGAEIPLRTFERARQQSPRAVKSRVGGY